MARPRTEQKITKPIGADGLTIHGRAHFEAILRARSDLNDSDAALVIEAARVFSLLQRCWEEYYCEGADAITVFPNGMPGLNPRLKLIESLQKQLVTLHRNLGIRSIDVPGETETEDASTAALFRVVT